MRALETTRPEPAGLFGEPPSPAEEGRPETQISTVQWGMGVFLAFTGSLMLVAPNQFGGAFWAALHDYLPWVGSFWLVAGFGVAGVAVAAMSRPWVVAAHLITALALLVNAANGVATQTWGSVVIYAVLAGGTALAPFLSSFERSESRNHKSLLPLVYGATIASYGTFILLFPGQFSATFYDSVRNYLPLYGAGFLASGSLLVFAQLRPGLPAWLFRAAHLPVLLPCVAYGVTNSIPIGAWTSVFFYFGFAPLVASLPWTGSSLNRLDPRSFSVRLAFILVMAVALPLVTTMAIVTAGQEQDMRAEGESDLETAAATLASDVSHYVGQYSNAMAALAAYPGLLDLPWPAQEAILRSYKEAYPDATLVSTRDASNNGIARSDGGPPSAALSNQDFAERFWRTNSPAVVLSISTITGAPILATVGPVRDAEGRLIGLVTIGFESQRISSILNQAGAAPGRKVYLVDAAGRAIAHPDESLVANFTDLSTTPPVASILADGRDHGIISYQGPSGDVLAAFARVPGLGWSVVGERTALAALWQVRSERNEAFGLLLGAMILAVAAGSLLARPIARPLAALSVEAGRLGRGESSAPLPHSRTSEIDQLVTTFISMRERLTERNAQIERRAAQLASANAELSSVNKDLEAFTYSVAHDLRSPVRHMDGFSKALMDRYADKLDERGKEYLGFVREGSVKMGQLIDDLLTLTGITRHEFTRMEVDLSEIARSVAVELQREQPARQVELVIAPEALANGDPRLLRIVLENLLGNAWKFTSRRERARIEFGTAQGDGGPAYYVCDNGAGFDMSYNSKLFRAFERLHSSDDFPGTGVGLAMVERIIRRHGGRVWAEGEVDKGAKFCFTLG